MNSPPTPGPSAANFDAGPAHKVYPLDATLAEWRCWTCGHTFMFSPGWATCPNNPVQPPAGPPGGVLFGSRPGLSGYGWEVTCTTPDGMTGGMLFTRSQYSAAGVAALLNRDRQPEPSQPEHPCDLYDRANCPESTGHSPDCPRYRPEPGTDPGGGGTVRWFVERSRAYPAAHGYTGPLSRAGAAAWAAAGRKLAPTVAELQASAIALYDTLITGEWPVAA